MLRLLSRTRAPPSFGLRNPVFVRFLAKGEQAKTGATKVKKVVEKKAVRSARQHP